MRILENNHSDGVDFSMGYGLQQLEVGQRLWSHKCWSNFSHSQTQETEEHYRFKSSISAFVSI